MIQLRYRAIPNQCMACVMRYMALLPQYIHGSFAAVHDEIHGSFATVYSCVIGLFQINVWLV